MIIICQVDDTDTSLRETGEPVITVTGTSAERTEAIPQVFNYDFFTFL